MVRSPHFRGYTRLGGELTRGEVDWREQIDIGPERPPIGGPGRPDYLWLQGPNQWPAGLPELPGIVDEWDAALSAVARTLLRHWAASLGGPRRRVRRRVRRDAGDPDQDRALPGDARPARRAWARTETPGCSRCCWPSRQPGLQVRAAATASWIDVPPLEGAFIVNIGELLEVATGGYLRATEHRVNLRESRGPRSRCRTSSIRDWTRRSRCCRCPTNWRQRAEPGADPSDPIFSVYGRNAWKSRLRAHPDVAAAHGYVTGSAKGVTPDR